MCFIISFLFHSFLFLFHLPVVLYASHFYTLCVHYSMYICTYVHTVSVQVLYMQFYLVHIVHVRCWSMYVQIHVCTSKQARLVMMLQCPSIDTRAHRLALPRLLIAHVHEFHVHVHMPTLMPVVCGIVLLQ